MEVTAVESQSLALRVQDDSGVGAARRAAVVLAERLGCTENEGGKVALIVTELATNLVRHGGGGEVLIRRTSHAAAGLEFVALDRGPGMASVAEALRDGYSTSGGSGVGLGAVRRIADSCEIFTALGAGSVVVARLGFGPAARPSGLVVSGVSVATTGETVCGDAWAWAAYGDRWAVLVVDGLGHGPAAAAASAEVVRLFRDHPTAGPADLLTIAHAALRPTRGAALAMAEVRPGQGVLTYTGVGNIGGVILTAGDSRSLISHPGIVGHASRKIQTFSYPWSDTSVLVMYSDGLRSRWTLDPYPGLATRDPALLAAVLYRDFARGRDDVTVVAGRMASA